jgi:hypothetical protein
VLPPAVLLISLNAILFLTRLEGLGKIHVSF